MEIVNKNIYKLSYTYTNYGHNPTQKNPIIIYVIKTNGEILTKKITKKYQGHDSWKGYSQLGTPFTTACAGRFDPQTKICTAVFYQTFSKEYVSTVLKEKFGNNITIEFYNFDNPIFANLNKNWYKVSRNINPNY